MSADHGTPPRARPASRPSRTDSAAPDTLTVAELVASLDRRFPPRLAEPWDNTGLLLGRRSQPVERLLTCLTLTPDVAEEAIEAGVDLIVTHHPILFTGAKRLTGDKPDSAALLDLIAAGVCVYSPHTAFDSAADGINAWLSRGLELTNVVPITADESEPAIGSGRIGRLPQPTKLADLAASLAKLTGQRGLHRVGDRSRPVEVVAIACGAAGSMMGDAIAAGAEAFVTGEIRFHDALEARSNGLALLVPGHYATERPAVEWLAGELGEEFPSLHCEASRRESDPLVWQPVPAVEPRR